MRSKASAARAAAVRCGGAAGRLSEGKAVYPLDEAEEEREESRAERREYGKVPTGRVRVRTPGVGRLKYVVDSQGNVVRVADGLT